MAELVGYIHSTESFGTVDGPGIRYVVFMQGCPMRCLYCHNPDSWVIGKGEARSAEEIISEIRKYRPFLKNGGLTVSGGEPMLQQEFVTHLFELARKEGIHTALDTSGILFDPIHPEKVDPLLRVTDLVLLDIKHIDEEEHRKLTGHSNRNILAFAKYLRDQKIPVWIRHVVVPGITEDPRWLRRLGAFLAELDNMKALDVLPYHTMGKVKYEKMGIPYPLGDTPALTKEAAIQARSEIIEGIKEYFKQR